MAEIKVLNANCDCATDGSCDCDLSELHFACNRKKMEVFPTLPATGVEGTTYQIGNNTDGYTEYVWNGTEFVLMGTATGSFYRIADFDNQGVVKLSLDSIMIDGGAIGRDGNGRIKVIPAAPGYPGVVRLGTASHYEFPEPFRIPVTVSRNNGRMYINLKQKQSDGSAGALKCEVEGQFTVGSFVYDYYSLSIEEASPSRMGVVKLLSSLNGYSDDELNAMRNTHAASVGLVLDGLEDFCEEFFTPTRIGGYFDAWALDKDLAQQIWDDTTKREVLFGNVVDIILDGEEFKSQLKSVSDAWLTNAITDDYITTLFKDSILAKTKEISDAHWDDDLEKTIEEKTKAEFDEQLPDAMAGFIANPDNVEIIAESVKEKVQESVSEDASEESLKYTKNVFNSSQTIEIGGVKTTFGAYFNAKIGDLLNERLVAIESKLKTITNNVEQIRSGALTTIGIGTFNSSEGTSQSFPLCANYDFIELSTNKGSCFIISVWEVKRAFDLGKSYTFTDYWGDHDDDWEEDGGQIRISPGWEFSHNSNYTSVCPIVIRGLKYSF